MSRGKLRHISPQHLMNLSLCCNAFCCVILDLGVGSSHSNGLSNRRRWLARLRVIGVSSAETNSTKFKHGYRICNVLWKGIPGVQLYMQLGDDLPRPAVRPRGSSQMYALAAFSLTSYDFIHRWSQAKGCQRINLARPTRPNCWPGQIVPKLHVQLNTRYSFPEYVTNSVILKNTFTRHLHRCRVGVPRFVYTVVLKLNQHNWIAVDRRRSGTYRNQRKLSSYAT